tara:strand:+ start:2138 stop:2971 length:834 start_codon:yes stop_codon:yes gene_type:complete
MIIWLASYPKSGNTWLRMFLKSYFLKPNEKFSLNKSILDNFKAQGFPDHKILDHLKIDYNKFSEIAKNWETMQDFINLNNRTNYVKTHNAMCTVGPYKFSSTKNTKGAIYLVRDPRDVLVSLSHHNGYDFEKTFEHLTSSYNFEYPDTGDKRYKKSLIGNWSDHYKSWKNFKSCKTIIIKYEDMVLDEFNTFKKIMNYLTEIDGIVLDEEKLKKALKQTQFKELQKMENVEGFTEKGIGKLFFRQGKIGGWKNDLSSDLIKKVEEKFSKEMAELGYL